MTSKRQFEWTTGKVWAIALVVIVGIIGVTVMDVASHPYILRIEMDNNTLAAVQNISTTAETVSFRQFQNTTRSLMWGGKNCHKASDGCNICCDVEGTGISTCTLMACGTWKNATY